MIMFYISIVKSFESVADSLVSQEDFTEISLLENNIAIRGEKVTDTSILTNCFCELGLSLHHSAGFQ